MKDISVYVSQCNFGHFDEEETVVVYAGTSLVDAVEAVENFKSHYIEDIKNKWVSEWVNGKCVQQLEIIC